VVDGWWVSGEEIGEERGGEGVDGRWQMAGGRQIMVSFCM